LNEPHSGHSATLLKDGRVLVAGGSDDVKPLKSAEIYDPESDVWTVLPDMLELRFGQAAVLLDDGRVLMVGGAGDLV
jgi:hypothetical protein